MAELLARQCEGEIDHTRMVEAHALGAKAAECAALFVALYCELPRSPPASRSPSSPAKSPDHTPRNSVRRFGGIVIIASCGSASRWSCANTEQ